MNSSDDDMFKDRPRQLMRGEPGSDEDNEMLDYDWNELDSGTFHNFQNAAAASDAAADQAARDQATASAKAARDQATASAKAARDQATASAKAARDQATATQAVADAQALVLAVSTRIYYAYYGQPQDIRDVIDRYIAKPSNFPPFSGAEQVERTKQYTLEQRREAHTAEREANNALEKALEAQRVAYRGGYKSKSKSKKSRYNKKSKTIKRRRTRTRTRSRTNKRYQ